MKTILRNGAFELVSVEEIDCKNDRILRGFNKDQNWYEAVEAYIIVNGDTTVEGLNGGLAKLLSKDKEIVELYTTLAISKNKTLGNILFDGHTISIGSGEFYMSDKSREALLLELVMRMGHTFSKQYYKDLIFYLQTGKIRGSKTPVLEIEEEIASKTLKMFIKEGYLEQTKDRITSTKKLFDWIKAYDKEI